MPADTTTRQQSVTALCRWAMGYALRRWPALVVVAGSQGLKIALDLLKPWPMVFLVDYVLRGQTMPEGLARVIAHLPGASTASGSIAWSVAATVVIFLLSWAIGLATAVGNISLGQRMTYDLAADLFARLQQLSLNFHARKSVGDLLRRVTADCGCVSVIVKDALLPLAASLVSLVAIFCVLWRIDPLLTLLAVGVAPCMALVFRRYAVPMMEGSYRQQEAEGRIYDLVEQTFTAIPIMQAFGREDFNNRKFKTVAAEAMSATLAVTRLQLSFKLLIGLATALGTAGILWLGTHHALDGKITLGAIIAFLSYLGSLYAPLESVMYTSSTIQGAAGSARRVWEVLNTEREVRDQPGARALLNVSGAVRFENVTFGYDPARPVVRDISFEISPREVVALVGATGAGKSTLVSLVARFFDPQQGKVTIDGFDIRDSQLKSVREQVAIVLQEPFLFPLSVAENIAYGRPHASLAEIEAAAKTANADEFIRRLPQGYQTVLGERGATLSGGERQRISIARALLKNAPILILDEPTSALDAETEQSLMTAIERLTANRTTFIIAHRLSTVRRATRILVLEDGRLAETGTHEELLQLHGIYARLHAAQFTPEVGGQAPEK